MNVGKGYIGHETGCQCISSASLDLFGKGRVFSLRTCIYAGIAVFLSGCSSAPRTGDIVHARVNFVVGEWLYEKVKAGDATERMNNPHRTQMVMDAINSGVSIDDVREGRLVLCSCRYGSNSGSSFMVLLPGWVRLDDSDRVELEIEAGIESKEGHPGTFSLFRRVLLLRTQGRTNCFPKDS